jgi:hypothetical protein
VTPALRRAGLGLVVLYTVVAALSRHVAPEDFLPLFDGFAPPQPYRWVKPPPEVARDNQPPTPAEREIPLGEGGSPPTNATTDDGQAIAALEAGAIPANPPDTALKLTLTPVDSGTLGPLPPELRAVSNAYRVSLAYQPSQTPVTQLAKPGTVALTASTAGDRFLFSADGASWQEKPSRPYGNTHGRFSTLETLGYYLVAGHSAPASPRPADEPRGPNPVLLFLVAVVPIVGAGLVLRPPPPPPPPASRSRRRPAPPARRPPAKSRTKKRS